MHRSSLVKIVLRSAVNGAVTKDACRESFSQERAAAGWNERVMEGRYYIYIFPEAGAGSARRYEHEVWTSQHDLGSVRRERFILIG